MKLIVKTFDAYSLRNGYERKHTFLGTIHSFGYEMPEKRAVFRVRNIQSVCVIRATMRLRVSVDPKLLAVFMLFVAHYCEPIAEPSDIFAAQ